MSETDFELVAASLRADATDLRAFVEALAVKLEGALPDRTAVERVGGGFRRPKRVQEIAVRLGDGEYALALEDASVACRRRVVVRGIALKNDDLTLDEWIDAISSAVAEEASASERGRAALARLLGAS